MSRFSNLIINFTNIEVIILIINGKYLILKYKRLTGDS